MLQDIIDETIEALRNGERESPGVYPLMYHTAAEQVLTHHDFSGTELNRLFYEMVEMQSDGGVLSNWQKLPFTSLSDFIGLAAKQQMGDEYVRLFNERMNYISPDASAYAE